MYLTPESLALKIGKWAGGRRVIDAGCGVGGNAIGFARAGCEVLAIELDPARAEMACHNAREYGMDERVQVEQGTATQRVQELAAGPRAAQSLLFCDPPWGADWNREGCTLEDFPLLSQLHPLRESFWELWAKVPASFDTHSCPGATAHAIFGDGEGDRRRVKFVLLRMG
jgi:SAM-dependent methyltransferase